MAKNVPQEALLIKSIRNYGELQRCRSTLRWGEALLSSQHSRGAKPRFLLLQKILPCREAGSHQDQQWLCAQSNSIMGSIKKPVLNKSASTD